MHTRWTFFGFEWILYLEIKPILHVAWETGDFSRLGIGGADDILAEFNERTDPNEICNTLIMELCGVGEPLHIDTGLPELIHDLRKTRKGEDAADHLGTLIAAEPYVEDWWRVDDGLAGILTPEHVKEAYSGLSPLHQTNFKPAAKGLASITRRFAPADPAAGRLVEMIDLLQEAADQEMGLGVLREL